MGPSGLSDDLRFVGSRRRMIEEIREKGTADLELLQLFDRVPRHRFMPEGVWNRAYEDAPIPIGYGQTISQPSLQAFYLSVLKPTRAECVLEIGTGSGFLTALLSHLADRVYSVERVRELSQRARQVLDGFQIRNVALMVGDGTIGWRRYAPYPVIVVSAASPQVPAALVDQLADPGRMLIPVGDRQQQDLILVERSGGATTERPVPRPSGGGFSFVPLLGRFAWEAES